MKQGASSSCYRHLQSQEKMTIWVVKDNFSASKQSTELFNHVWLHRDKLARSDWFRFDYFNHMADGDIGGGYRALTDASSRDDCFI